MHARALSLALALLLLFTQQFGLQHMLLHALRSPAAGSMASAGPAQAAPATPAGNELTSDKAADSLCQTCLALMAIGAATLPALLHRRATRPRASAPPHQPRPALAARPGAPYLARAPPSSLALT